MNCKALCQEIDYVMRMLGVKDCRRVIQIFRNSIDPVALCRELGRLAARSGEQVAAALMEIEFLAPIGASYSLRIAQSVDPQETSDRELEVEVCPECYRSPYRSPLFRGSALSEFLKVMRRAAVHTEFVFRDRMAGFVGRFLGLSGGAPDNPDLEEIISRIDAHLNRLEISRMRYFISSGIGANEMYSHQLALIFNAHFADIRSGVKWLVVNNPAHIRDIPPDACDANTVVFEISRSGGTKETVDFFNATKDRFRSRIVVANRGVLKDEAGRLAARSAPVLIIDDVRGDIGGRQMNRRTLMVYAPLYVALCCGLKDRGKARELLGHYCSALFDATAELGYERGAESAAVSAAEFLLRHRQSGRSKIFAVYDDNLRCSVKELFQLINEGANKNAAGGSNNNVVEEYSLVHKRGRLDQLIEKCGKTAFVIMLRDTAGGDCAQAESLLGALRAREVPFISLRMNLGGTVEAKARVLARASALMQDMAVYFTFITNQDANSNPAVKFVREITAAMFEILQEKKSCGGGRSIGFEDVLVKIRENSEQAAEDARRALDRRAAGREEYRSEFDELSGPMRSLCADLRLSEDSAVESCLGAIPADVFKSDFGEAGGCKIKEIDEAFSRSILPGALGKFSAAPQVKPLTRQCMIAVDGMRVSVAAAAEEAESALAAGSCGVAQYMAGMCARRKAGLSHMTLAFMEIDSNNPLIDEIAAAMVNEFSDLGISVPLLPLPRVAHTGIEAVMSHLGNIFSFAILYTDTYGPPLGSKEIGKNLSMDEATYVYGIANVIRMAIGGAPSVIVEIRNSRDLPRVRDLLVPAFKEARRLLCA